VILQLAYWKSLHFPTIVVGAKAPRKQLGAGGSNLGSPGSNDKHSGGNPVRWTSTPTWQKGMQL
jgi:hypothetical protein